MEITDSVAKLLEIAHTHHSQTVFQEADARDGHISVYSLGSAFGFSSDEHESNLAAIIEGSDSNEQELFFTLMDDDMYGYSATPLISRERRTDSAGY